MKYIKIFIIGIFFILIIKYFILSFPENFFQNRSSLEIYSEEGIPIFVGSGKQNTKSKWTPLDYYPKKLKEIVLYSEDKRFYWHIGIDPAAMIRSLSVNLANLKILTGGSTITQQLARIVFKEYLISNKYIRKLEEIFFALRLEMNYSKDEIFEAYLNLVPMPNNISGLESLSIQLFGRSTKFLNTEEMIQITLLIRNKNSNSSYFRKNFFKIWNYFEKSSYPLNRDLIFSKANLFKKDSSTSHFIDWVKNEELIYDNKFYSTINYGIQRKIIDIVNQEIRYLEKYGGTEAAAVVIELPEKDEKFLKLKAMVGSKDFNGKIDGQVNGAIQKRNAGSILKPFLYGLGVEKKILTFNQLISDSELGFTSSDSGETFLPENNDHEFWGNLTISEALVNSRNIPSYKVIQKVGIIPFQSLLVSLSLLKTDFSLRERLGLGMAMGTGGVELLNVSKAYTVFKMQGKLYPLLVGKTGTGKEIITGESREIFTSETSDKLLYTLADRELRRRGFGRRNFLDFPFDVAAKTGTSKDSIDAWVIGLTDRYAVGVWVGNFKGKKMKEVSGAWGAGRIFHSIVRMLTSENNSKFIYSDSLSEKYICRLSGKFAGENCPSFKSLFNKDEVVLNQCNDDHSMRKTLQIMEPEFKVVSPLEKEVYFINSNLPLENQKIPFIFSMNKDNNIYKIKLNEMEERKLNHNEKFFMNLKKGNYSLKIWKNDEFHKEIQFTVN